MRAVWVLCGPVLALMVLALSTVTFLVLYERRALKAEVKRLKHTTH